MSSTQRDYKLQQSVAEVLTGAAVSVIGENVVGSVVVILLTPIAAHQSQLQALSCKGGGGRSTPASLTVAKGTTVSLSFLSPDVLQAQKQGVQGQLQGQVIWGSRDASASLTTVHTASRSFHQHIISASELQCFLTEEDVQAVEDRVDPAVGQGKH